MKSLKLPSIAQYLLFITNLALGFVETLIGLRIILKLFGASTQASFVTWVYETTKPLLSPFAGIFPAPVLDGYFVVEFSAIFALIVYAFLAYFIEAAVNFLDDRKDG